MNSSVQAERACQIQMRSKGYDKSSCSNLRSLRLETHMKSRIIDKSTQTERSRKLRWSGRIFRSFKKRKSSIEVSYVVRRISGVFACICLLCISGLVARYAEETYMQKNVEYVFYEIHHVEAVIGKIN